MHRAAVQGCTRANTRDKCRPWSHVSCRGCWVWTFPSILDAVHQPCAGRAAHGVCLLCHFIRDSAFTASVLHQQANLSSTSMSAYRVPAQLRLVSTSGDHPSQLSQQPAQSCILSGFEYPQGWTCYNTSGQSVSVFDPLTVKTFLPIFKINFLYFH